MIDIVDIIQGIEIEIIEPPDISTIEYQNIQDLSIILNLTNLDMITIEDLNLIELEIVFMYIDH